MNDDNLKNQDLITGNGFESTSNADLKEKFVNDYSMKMGWDRDSLTDEQLTEIHSQKGYQCPGMICG